MQLLAEITRQRDFSLSEDTITWFRNQVQFKMCICDVWRTQGADRNAFSIIDGQTGGRVALKQLTKLCNRYIDCHTTQTL